MRMESMRKFLSKIILFTDKLVSLIILATIFVVIFFALFEFYKLYADFSKLTAERVLHVIALTIVFVKAYRTLLDYMHSHHVSVKYIVEISIIAPAIELIFAPENRSFEINALFAVFSIGMLVAYAFFYKTLSEADKEWSADTHEMLSKNAV